MPHILNFVSSQTATYPLAGTSSSSRGLSVTTRVASSSAGVGLLEFPSLPTLHPIPSQPRIHAEVGRYRLRLAVSGHDREAACRLRFRVFNLEMGKGLDASYETGIDTDPYDRFCDHLLVEDQSQDNPLRRIIGTYRLQTGTTALENLGYYSQQEFDFTPYEHLRPEILELGRASIDREHRTPEVLTLLWRGIAQYATDMQLRYLIGCSSLNTADPREGWQIFRQLENYRAASELQTRPTDAFLCPPEAAVEPESHESSNAEAPKPPKLLKTYLAIGARICSAPAWDREFGTIDFLTLMDLRAITSSARNRFLAPLTQ